MQSEIVPKPKIIKRKCGGYLAISQAYTRFKIGVEADTPALAEAKFWREYRRWQEIVDEAQGNDT